jgi:hypothetical protein
MKKCTKCEIEKPLNMFCTNDYNKPVSRCKECMNVIQIEYMRKKKELKTSSELLLSQDSTTINSNENEYKKEIKCKTFFFYQHT